MQVRKIRYGRTDLWVVMFDEDQKYARKVKTGDYKDY